MYLKTSTLTLASLVMLSACGGGSDSNSENNPSLPAPQAVQQGLFLDSPVANLDYRNLSGSRSGQTTAEGLFDYLPGESLEFSIGDLDIGRAVSCAVMTPMTLAGTVNVRAPRVNNLVRLLLTLDQDANPDNGIQITDNAKAVATQVDFSLSADEFALSPAVTNLIFNGGQDTPVTALTNVELAADHFFQSFVDNTIDPCTVDEINEKIMIDFMTDKGLPVQRDDSGMYYAITTEGTGDAPLPDSRVTIKYRGYFTSDVTFDETSGDNTATFNLNNLIDGWSHALPLLKPGGKGTFAFPPDLGYGSQGSFSIPGNIVIVFDIELISFE